MSRLYRPLHNSIWKFEAMTVPIHYKSGQMTQVYESKGAIIGSATHRSRDGVLEPESQWKKDHQNVGSSFK